MRQPHIGAASRTPQSPQSSPELPHSHLDTSVGSATSSPSSVPAPASTASHVTFRAPGAPVQRQEDVQVHAAFAGRPERYAAARTAGGGLQAALGKPRKQTRKPRKLPSLGCNALRRGRMGTVQWVFFLIPYVLLLHFSVVFAWAKADIFNPKYAPYKAGFRRTNRDSVPRAFEYTAEAVGVVAMGFSCLMMLVCLYRAHATSPGVVVRALFVEADHFETKSDGSPRKCRKCDHKNPPPKVDRCHHCKWCRRCVLSMDHHCMLLAACVGRCNYKYFFLLLVYTSTSLVLFLVFTAFPALSAFQSLSSLGKDFYFMLSWLLAFCLTCVLLPFTGFHILLVSRNFTTIEWCERKRKNTGMQFSSTNQDAMMKELIDAAVAKDMGDKEFSDSLRHVLYQRSPFDVGLCGNLRHALGPAIFWFVPVRWGMRDTPPFPTSAQHKRLVKQLKAGLEDIRRAKVARAATGIAGGVDVGDVTTVVVTAEPLGSPLPP